MTSTDADDLVRTNVTKVVDALAEACPDLPQIMLVGAVCRDVLHHGQGHRFPLRRTDDLDLALAVVGLVEFEQLRAAFPRSGSGFGPVRHQIAGVQVDLVPFGPGVEEPDGVVTPRESMSVFGFQDVLSASRRVALSSGHEVHVPTIAGYALLKLKAWADRSTFHEYKDGGDLACAMYWYQNDPKVEARLFEEPEAVAHFVAAELDTDVAAVRLLAHDALDLLSADRRAALQDTWGRLRGGDSLLATYLANNYLDTWPRGSDAVDRRTSYAAAIRDAMMDS